MVIGSDEGGKGTKPVIVSGGGTEVSGGTETKSFGKTITTAKDQTQKGKLFIAGASSLDFSLGGSKSKYDDEVDENSQIKYFDFNFMPKVGYFVIDNLVAGLYWDAGYYSRKPKNESTSSYMNKETSFSIGPFARFYIPVCDRLIPYAEAQVGFGSSKNSSRCCSDDDWIDSKYGLFTYRLGGGATYFFNNAVGADMFMGYMHDATKYKDSDNGEKGSDSKTIYNQFILQLGIVVILDL